MDFTKNLGKDEEVIVNAKTHWACLIPHILLIFVYIGVITIWKPIIRMCSTKLTVTNKRVYGKYGLINTKSLDTPLNKVTTVSVSNGLFGKIFGYGNVVVNTAAGTFNFKYIKSPENFRVALMDEIERYEEERIKRQASELASAIKN